MGRLVVIVEGDGEVEAVPLLMRRILYEYHQRYEFTQIDAKSASGRDNLLKEGGPEVFLNYARHEGCEGLLVLLDTEDKQVCPLNLADELARRTQTLGLPFPVVVVCAACEYESWFLASLHTLAGRGKLNPGINFENDPEEVCNAKEWLTKNMDSGNIYKETTDQVKMTALLDFPTVAKRSRSFKRMLHAVEELLHAIDTGDNRITPLKEM